jgi:integrase
MVHTGLRVDETKSIIWRNVDFKSSTLLLERAGKTKSNRRVLLRRGALKVLHRLRHRRLEYFEAKGLVLNQSEAIISLPNGKRVNSMKKGFAELLKACGFATTNHLEKYTLTSLRHTYATIRLTTRLGKRSSLQALSKQMGTSIRMIVRHYGHDEIEDYRSELLS